MVGADGIILGSPTYFADVTSEIKALIERAGFTAMANGFIFKRKVGAAVVAVRKGGAIHAFDSINHFFQINQMDCPGFRLLEHGIGREIGDVDKDDEGLQNMKNLGENKVWLLKKIKADG